MIKDFYTYEGTHWMMIYDLKLYLRTHLKFLFFVLFFS